jgi:hypothetical protein
MCDICSQLMRAYDAAVAAYTKASRGLSGLMGDDFDQAFEQCEKLRLACRSAHEAIMDHIAVEH